MPALGVSCRRPGPPGSCPCLTIRMGHALGTVLSPLRPREVLSPRFTAAKDTKFQQRSLVRVSKSVKSPDLSHLTPELSSLQMTESKIRGRRAQLGFPAASDFLLGGISVHVTEKIRNQLSF